MERLSLAMNNWSPHWRRRSNPSLTPSTLWTEANPDFVDLTDIESDYESSDEMDESI